MKVVVIGAGLAGAATAHALAERGCKVTVLEAGGATSSTTSSTAPSGSLPVALMAPHHSVDDNITSQLSRLGLAATTQAARALLVEGQDWQMCGALQRAGKLGPQARWSGDAAWVKPAALVAAWLAHPRITLRTGVQVHSLSMAGATLDPFALSLSKGSQKPWQAQSVWQALDAQGTALAEADAVVLANAYQAKALFDSIDNIHSTGSPAPTLALHKVAGQVIYGPWTAQWQALWPQLLPELREHTDSTAPCAINGNGHFIPAIPWHSGPIWLSGSTYEHDIASPQVTAQGISANLQRLQQLIPAAAQLLDQQHSAGQLQAWAGERCTTRDRLPMVGASHAPGIFVCTAMGSRGLSLAALCGQHLAATITQAHDSALPAHLHQAVALSRF
jgi:tRNA 5-methylaminomethyl-2-thiouridine biosynthesis bifunctional protein